MERLSKTIIILAVIGIGAYFAYNYIESRHQMKLRTAVEQEQVERLAKEAELRSQIAELEEKLAQYRPAPVSPEKMAEVFGDAATAVTPEPEEFSCEELEERIISFLGYIDRQSYMEAFQREIGTHHLFQQIVTELSEKRPMVAGEMKDLYSLIRNVAHFYRVLGKEPIKMILVILKNESEVIEDVMANLFAWFSLCNKCEQVKTNCPSIEVLYEYAGFFLNTLAGRSYLLRRDSKVRILTNYYSVLILDKANDESLNPYGIDIRPYINVSSYETTNVKGLAYQERYLKRLGALKEKYGM
jgi:hypothetical protein